MYISRCGAPWEGLRAQVATCPGPPTPLSPSTPPSPPTLLGPDPPSPPLDDQEPVAVGVAKEEHRRYRPPHAHDGLICGPAAGPQVRVVGVDVLGGEGHVGVDPDRFALLWWHQGDGTGSPRRRHFDPAVPPPEGDVGALLESERSQVELERAVLVAHGNDHGPDLGDPRLGRGLSHEVLLSRGFSS